MVIPERRNCPSAPCSCPSCVSSPRRCSHAVSALRGPAPRARQPHRGGADWHRISMVRRVAALWSVVSCAAAPLGVRLSAVRGRDQPMTSQLTDSLDEFTRTSQLMTPRRARPPGAARALPGWLPRSQCRSACAASPGLGGPVITDICRIAVNRLRPCSPNGAIGWQRVHPKVPLRGNDSRVRPGWGRWFPVPRPGADTASAIVK
jgi:hypothetical protein